EPDVHRQGEPGSIDEHVVTRRMAVEPRQVVVHVVAWLQPAPLVNRLRDMLQRRVEKVADPPAGHRVQRLEPKRQTLDGLVVAGRQEGVQRGDADGTLPVTTVVTSGARLLARPSIRSTLARYATLNLK